MKFPNNILQNLHHSLTQDIRIACHKKERTPFAFSLNDERKNDTSLKKSNRHISKLNAALNNFKGTQHPEKSTLQISDTERHRNISR